MAEPGAGQSPAGMNHLEPELEEKHKKQEDSCNSPIPRRPTGVIEGALRTRVYSFRQPYLSRYWSRETSA